MSDTKNRARVDTLLTDVSTMQKAEGLISDQVLTHVTAAKDTGLIGKYGKEHLRIEHDIVAGDQPYPRVTVMTKGSRRYQIETHGLSITVTEKQKKNEDQPFDALQDATIVVTDKIRLGKELALAIPLTDVTVLTQNTTLAGTDQFNDYTNSDPLGRFATGKNEIFEGSGQLLEFTPDGVAIVPWQVFNILRFHPQIIENIKYVVNKKQGLSKDELAAAMGVGRLLVPFARQNNSKEGQADSMQPIWGKDIVMLYAPKTGTKHIETLGFHVTPKTGIERVFRNAINNPPNSDEILVDMAYDFLLTEVGAAYLIKDAIA